MEYTEEVVYVLPGSGGSLDCGPRKAFEYKSMKMI